MSEMLFTGVRRMHEGDLNVVLNWRNHPEVRRFMYTQHEISQNEHAEWFAKCSRDSMKHLLIFESGSKPLGFVSIHENEPGCSSNWGFYIAPDAPKGTGRALGKAALQYGFETAKMQKICGQALAFNERSIRFHISMGFQCENILNQKHFDGDQYHDVVCFGLLASQWRKGE